MTPDAAVLGLAHRLLCVGEPEWIGVEWDDVDVYHQGRYLALARLIAPALELPEPWESSADESSVLIKSDEWSRHVAAIRAVKGE